jgi:hypothetical protein
MKLIKKQNFHFLLICIILVSSCSHKTECDETLNSSADIGFYTITNQSEVSAVFDNVTALGVQSDSLLYNESDNLSSVFLPMDHSLDSCIFVMRIEAVTDTLKFRYTRKLDFISENCGFSTEFTLIKLETTNYLIDSVKIVNPVINRSQSENIKIYY